MTKIFRAYYVWPRFPSVSMSGNTCALQCQHCNHTYLQDMQNVNNPKKLLETCYKFFENNAVGFLLSGGCDKNGEMLNLRQLLPTVKQIKKETDLIVKLHSGLVNQSLAEEIVSAGVDIASVEVVGSNETIHQLFGYHATTESYRRTLESLESAGISYIAPHICIGLHYGTLNGEVQSLEMIQQSCTPSSLVMIVFRPTKATLLEHCQTPSPSDVSTVITTAKTMFPNQDIALGCLRPRTRYREDIEFAALKAGATRMEIPSKKDKMKSRAYRKRKIEKEIQEAESLLKDDEK